MRSWSKVAAVGLLLAAGFGCYPPMQEVTSGPDVDAVGHEAVAAWNAEFTGMFDVTGGYTGSEVVVLGDWAIERYTGEVTLTPAEGEAATATFKGIHIYQRQADGSWKIAQDIWNMDAPE